MHDFLAQKLGRFETGRPTVLDLFSGCGGISLGFHRAGCDVLGGVELNELAAQTHAANFHAGEAGEDSPHGKSLDVSVEDPVELVRRFGAEIPERAVDIIVGGPPCQAYARVGRAKLREVREHPEAFKVDERGSLFEHYLRFVAALRPVAILMENVPDILSYGGDNVAEVIADGLEGLGYHCRYTLLNAAAYGVPQTRERFYLLAWDERVAASPPTFPRPKHHLDELPIGYRGTRAVARKLADAWRLPLVGTAERPNHYDPCGYFGWEGLGAPVSTEEAIGDLPKITGHLTGEIKRGARRFKKTIPYDAAPDSDYAKLMREGWAEFSNDVGVADHVIRYLPRDFPIFRAMKEGDQYPEAHKKALELRDAEHKRIVRRRRRQLSAKELADLTARMVPPYDVGKFPNKWRKLERDAPSRTLMAHLGHDSYSHIHYDDEQARTISVREAARLQSFPDGFVFRGTMNPAFRMIGNAVPPLMSFALARHLLTELRAHLHAGRVEMAAGGG